MNFKSALISIALSSLIVGCGGGGGDTQAGVQQTSSTAAVIRIDSAVPAATSSTITAITSPYQSIAPSGQMDLTSVPDGGSFMAFATNANGDSVLAGIVSSGDSEVALTPTSTATAFVLQIVNLTSESVSNSQWTDAIKSAGEFNNLVALISNANAANIPPLLFGGVSKSLLLTSAQAIDSISNSAAPSSTGKAKGLALANPTVSDVTSILSYPIGDSTLFPIAYVTGADQSVKGVQLNNQTNISFSAYGRQADASAALIPTGYTDPDGNQVVELDAGNVFNPLIIGNYSVPGNGGIWNLTVYHSLENKRRDILETTKYVWGVVLGELGVNDGDCLQQVVVNGFLEAPLAAVPYTSSSAFSGVEESISKPDTWTSAWNVFYTCVSENAPLYTGSKKAAAAKFLSKFTSTSAGQEVSGYAKIVWRNATQTAATIGDGDISALYKKFGLAVNAVSLAARTYFMVDYWDASYTVGVCEAVNPSSMQLEIANCAASLSPTPSTKDMSVGDNFTLSVAAKDASGNATLTPSQLQYSSSDTTTVSVDSNGVITVLKVAASPVTITAVEPITGVSGTMTVNVKAVSATIQFTPTSIALGGSSTLTWSSNDASACTATGDWSGSVATSGTRVVTPTAAGTLSYGISCVGAGVTAFSTATLTVQAAAATSVSVICGVNSQSLSWGEIGITSTCPSVSLGSTFGQSLNINAYGSRGSNPVTLPENIRVGSELATVSVNCVVNLSSTDSSGFQVTCDPVVADLYPYAFGAGPKTGRKVSLVGVVKTGFLLPYLAEFQLQWQVLGQ